ncbi:hypothetical protein [Micromonospora carbonacea]|uniref:hypothetical protein n=1 Tax=Micromonospora carbonacea TaxID=47853 RepID=UPI003712E9CE
MASSITQAHDASTTRETPATPATRDSAFGLVSHGVSLKLPLPMSIGLSGGVMVLRLDDNNTRAVNQWAAFLNLPMPTRHGAVHDVDSGKPWCSFGHDGYFLMPRLTGWHGMVWCLTDATADEVAAARNAGKVDA